MMKNQEKENELTCDDDFKFLQLFIKLFNATNSQGELYNSTKLRRLINNADSPCISTKSFDAYIRLLNEKLPYNRSNINAAYQKPSDMGCMPLHTYVFYHRLPFCLSLNLYGEELYNKKVEDDEHKRSREKLNILLGIQHSDNSPSYIYTFDIHNFYMPPFFAPLFIGILGSLNKEKSSWEKFRENALQISEDFYNEKHPEINPFLSENADTRRKLYTYWLELHFPDELFALTLRFDKMIHGNDGILSHNLNILADALSKEKFFTRINQKAFLQQIDEKLTLYYNTPLIDPSTHKPRNLDLCNEYKQASDIYHIEEINHLSE